MTSEPETSTALQRASPESNALVIGVERAYVALRDARNDFERLIVLGRAQAIAAAAAVLKHRDIQTEASLLVSSAEREIHKANPPQQGRRTDLEDNFVAPDNEVDETGDDFYSPEVEVDQRLVQNIRAAHDKLTDEQFQQVAEQAREKGDPLTRAVLKREAKKFNPPELKGEPDKPKPPTKAERLEAERDALAFDVQEKAEENEGLERALREARAQMSEYPHEREKVATEREAIISTLQSQLNEYMVNANEDSHFLRYWKREAKKPCRNCGTEWEFTDD